MSDDQPSYAAARAEPHCLRGHGRMKRVPAMDSPHRKARFFKCREDWCRCIIAVEVPYCGTCDDHMKLKSIWDVKKGEARLYWRCDKDNKSEAFEPCFSCHGTGWLHMDNRPDDERDSHNNLGFVCGTHIDRCDDCGRHRFEDAIAAELAHRKECGCGHGLPRSDDAFTWIDYGGREGEVYHALVKAGFKPVVTDSSDGEDFRTLEVIIAEGEADKFIATLDTAYAAMKGLHAKKLEMRASAKTTNFSEPRIGPIVVESFGVFLGHPDKPDGAPICWGKQWALDDEECGACSHERGCSEETTTNQEGIVMKDDVTQKGYLSPKKDRGVPELTGRINSPVDHISVFTREQVVRSGCKIIERNNGAILTTFDGKPIVILDKIVPETDPGSVEKKMHGVRLLEEFKTAALELLSQLNLMRFTDQPVKEQHRLEARRRGLLTALDGMEALKQGKNPQNLHKETSWARDRLAQVDYRGQLSLASGYRIEGLEKEDGVVQGRIYVDGQHYHLVAVAVHEIDGLQTPVDDPNEWYHSIGNLNDSAMTTIKIPGFEGNYVIAIYPGGI